MTKSQIEPSGALFAPSRLPVPDDNFASAAHEKHLMAYASSGHTALFADGGLTGQRYSQRSRLAVRAQVGWLSLHSLSGWRPGRASVQGGAIPNSLFSGNPGGASPNPVQAIRFGWGNRRAGQGPVVLR